MELRFDALLYSTVTWVTQSLMRAISNVHVGPRFLTPDVNIQVRGNYF